MRDRKVSRSAFEPKALSPAGSASFEGSLNLAIDEALGAISARGQEPRLPSPGAARPHISLRTRVGSSDPIASSEDDGELVLTEAEFAETFPGEADRATEAEHLRPFRSDAQGPITLYLLIGDLGPGWSTPPTRVSTPAAAPPADFAGETGLQEASAPAAVPPWEEGVDDNQPTSVDDGFWRKSASALSGFRALPSVPKIPAAPRALVIAPAGSARTASGPAIFSADPWQATGGPERVRDDWPTADTWGANTGDWPMTDAGAPPAAVHGLRPSDAPSEQPRVPDVLLDPNDRVVSRLKLADDPWGSDELGAVIIEEPTDDPADAVTLAPPAFNGLGPFAGGAEVSQFSSSDFDYSQAISAASRFRSVPSLSLAVPRDLVVVKQTSLPALPSPQAGSSELLVVRARDRFRLHDFDSTLEMLEEIPADARSPEAAQILEDTQRHLLEIYESKIGTFDRAPELLISAEQVIWLNLDHRAGFILSQIDGSVSYEDLLSLSGMPRIDTLRIICNLIETNVIGVRS